MLLLIINILHTHINKEYWRITKKGRNMSNLKFDVDFTEAMNFLFTDGGWIQGENFAPNVYAENFYGTAVVKTINNEFAIGEGQFNMMITPGILNQKYRKLNVLNWNELTAGRISR